mmetsp:Transcript_85397/g.242073  ORF Transcript_85397/g.242073 Transcript_85397/m.242073 type:complete len:212 (+) Transcript_85397:327-962(+)
MLTLPSLPASCRFRMLALPPLLDFVDVPAQSFQLLLEFNPAVVKLLAEAIDGVALPLCCGPLPLDLLRLLENRRDQVDQEILLWVTSHSMWRGGRPHLQAVRPPADLQVHDELQARLREAGVVTMAGGVQLVGLAVEEVLDPAALGLAQLRGLAESPEAPGAVLEDNTAVGQNLDGPLHEVLPRLPPQLVRRHRRVPDCVGEDTEAAAARR